LENVTAFCENPWARAPSEVTRIHDLTFRSGRTELKNLANPNTFKIMQTKTRQVALSCFITALNNKVFILLYQRKAMDYF
jgi:hypothetical protein